MRISDWSSDVCSSDLCRPVAAGFQAQHLRRLVEVEQRFGDAPEQYAGGDRRAEGDGEPAPAVEKRLRVRPAVGRAAEGREGDGGQKRKDQDAADRDVGAELATYPVVEGRFGGMEAHALLQAGEPGGGRKSKPRDSGTQSGPRSTTCA